MIVDAFLPAILGSVTIAVGLAAANTPLPGSTASTTFNAKQGGEFLELNNTGTATVFIEVFNRAQVIVPTVAASYPILPGQCKVIKRAPGDDTIGTISGSAAQSLIVSVGTGL